MLVRENVDILVAYIDHYAAEKIEPLFNAANRLLIVIEPGATVPSNWNASPLRFHLTLDAAFANFITAAKAIKDGVKNAAFGSTFYDAGYLSCSSLVNRFMNKGGKMAYNCIVPFKYEEFDITPLAAAIEEHHIDGVLAHLSIESGAVFLDAYQKAGLSSKISKFYVSPFVFEEQFLDKLPFPFTGIKGCVPWARGLQNETNTTFMSIMDEEFGKTGNCFAALAWDAAQFTAAAVQKLSDNKYNSTKAAEALAGFMMNGTRGVMELDAKTNYMTAPIHDAEIVKGDNGMSKLSLGERTNTPEDWEEFTSITISDTSSRWLNTYLCTT
jgi:branched-chain amino acid transport system substrate-binding protein